MSDDKRFWCSKVKCIEFWAIEDVALDRDAYQRNYLQLQLTFRTKNDDRVIVYMTPKAFHDHLRNLEARLGVIEAEYAASRPYPDG
jgi:hypothetical protein